MKKSHISRTIFREVIFIVICLVMIGTAFATSEKNILNSDGEMLGNIVFPTDAGESANGVSLSLYDYTEENIRSMNWALDPDTKDLLSFSLEAVEGTYPCNGPEGPCSFTRLVLIDSQLERNTGECTAPGTTTINDDGTISMSVGSCAAGMFIPEAVTYVEALASYTCVGFNTPLNNKHHKIMKMNRHRVLPLRATLEDNDGQVLEQDDVSAPPVVQVMYTPSVTDEMHLEAVDVSADVLGVGKAQKALASTGNMFIYKGNKWAFNLKTDSYSAPGLYTVSLVSGNSDEYEVTMPCVTSFIVK